jgi:hypothetical protein
VNEPFANAVIGACESTGWGITRELDEALGRLPGGRNLQIERLYLSQLLTNFRTTVHLREQGKRR